MSRNLPAPILSATTAAVVEAIILVEADFASGFLRLHSGYGSITFNGATFLGVGYLGKISQVTEDVDLAVSGVTFELSGIPSEMIALVLGEHYQGRPIRAWFAVSNGAGGVQSGAFEFFTGRMDTSSIQEGAETSTVTISAENELSDLRRSREIRYTHEEMRVFYPSEYGFEYVAKMLEKTINWGRVYRSGEGPAGNTVSSKITEILNAWR